MAATAQSVIPPKPKRQTLPIDRVVPNPRNDNIHPQSQIDLLVESIRGFGQPRAILVRQENRMIISGHGVWEAMKQAGESEVDCFVWDVDQRTADAFLLADNRFHELSRIDPERRRELLTQFTELEFASMGFLADDMADLLEAPEPLVIQEMETGPVTDTFWISVRGPLAQQAPALQRIREIMAELPEVEVELGTVTGIM